MDATKTESRHRFPTWKRLITGRISATKARQRSPQYKSLQRDRSFEAASVSRETERVLAGGGGETDGIGATLASAYANYRDDPRTEPVQAIAFWLAVVLPLVHLPILATGLSNGAETTLFVGLLGLNVVAVVAGHAHRA